MKILFLLPLFFVSCAAFIRTPATRMVSPEAQGGLGKGALELRLQAMKKDKLDFSNEQTNNAIDRDSTPYALAAMGEIGFFSRLDLFLIPNLAASPTIMGLKYQFLGAPKSEAKAGNISASLMVGYGERNESYSSSGDLDDILNDNVSKIEMNNRQQDIGLVSGYRWRDNLLHYANVIYFDGQVEGKVTTDSGILNRKNYKYRQDGMMYSTGLIYYFAKAHWKFDYSHFTSDWTHTEKQTINTINTTLGFDW